MGKSSFTEGDNKPIEAEGPQNSNSSIWIPRLCLDRCLRDDKSNRPLPFTRVFIYSAGMSKIEIMFSRELYEEDAVRDAAEMFEDFAAISVNKAGKNLRMHVAARKGAPLQDMIVGEIMNFVLARTVELKAT